MSGGFPLRIALGKAYRLRKIGILTAIYPAVWSIGKLFTGAWSDRWGVRAHRLPAVVIVVFAVSVGFSGFATGAFLLG
ncbi:hypothetical protein HSBAA_PA_3090 (plasmid) [Vreelandella sulfidaeris]|uniref:Major facilitator superfamily (MFS) profile domain-containing protein n=1 Tax=Vreelandella sulfidaeris TaxID=115553 RepID=A0A455UHH7_9GAMM|nr:hypothetical protein HSBAA_PA_3090 [Halomonas sulfidaeris]